ncbi:restriction endonuclease [Sorangium sp. So ce1389]|uniref:restriction endonuclease n=1 Tax=Sorangium sp. So ce1389 TaxID=3133336 RepID=UPI003F5FEFC5
MADLRITASGAALERYDGFDDESALSLLQQEVERHLLRHGASKSWATMEDATAAILRSFGYQVRLTARSKDDGVDIILDGSTHGAVFVQVKHSRNKVDVEVFRELVGTMCIEGVHSGMLVTSSRFTGPTKQLADRAQARGIVVELVDGERFLAALNLCARLRPPTLKEISLVVQPRVVLIDERIEI